MEPTHAVIWKIAGKVNVVTLAYSLDDGKRLAARPEFAIYGRATVADVSWLARITPAKTMAEAKAQFENW